jgi:hypothetical protein
MWGGLIDGLFFMIDEILEFLIFRPILKGFRNCDRGFEEGSIPQKIQH